jgi:hypothetical protein
MSYTQSTLVPTTVGVVISASGSPIAFCSNISHQIPLKLTSTNFLIWNMQFMPMLRGCALEHQIDGSHEAPPKLTADGQPNPAYMLLVR